MAWVKIDCSGVYLLHGDESGVHRQHIPASALPAGCCEGVGHVQLPSSATPDATQEKWMRARGLDPVVFYEWLDEDLPEPVLAAASAASATFCGKPVVLAEVFECWVTEEALATGRFHTE